MDAQVKQELISDAERVFGSEPEILAAWYKDLEFAEGETWDCGEKDTVTV